MPIQPDVWPQLFEAVYEINSATTHADFASAVVAGMSQLIPSDVAVFQILNRATGQILTRMAPSDPYTPEEVGWYSANSDQHPLVAYFARTGDQLARRLSDIIDEKSWLQTEMYQRCLQRLDLRFHLALPVTIDASLVAALSFSRSGTDFTLHDCELLDAFGPHFRQAWQRHENPWKDAGETEHAARRRFEELGLSPRESEVLYWMTEGKQNREIADILGLRLGTVQEYVAALLAKLRQENRHAATVHAIGLLRAR
jgi:DNA-binding CsgD family transcriptional regulator